MNTFKELSKSAGTDKTYYHGYHYFYPRYLESFRTGAFSMLEIGYGNGESTELWLKYFPKAEIFVMDIDVSLTDTRLKVIKGDQSNEDDLRMITGIIGRSKFIIDDGSHNPVHQFETFQYLFKNLLEPGGIYIIEDIECSYWNPKSVLYGYQAGYFSLINHLKGLADVINHEYSGLANELMISSVTFGQNCVVIVKRTEEEQAYFDRNYRFDYML